jgi:hypothetical protein
MLESNKYYFIIRQRMTEDRSELILNPEDYSADMYMEENENPKSIYLRVLMQLLLITIIFGALIFSYKYIMKNYYDDIHLWMTEKKVAIVIREEAVMPKVELEIKKIEKKKIVKVPLVAKLKPQVVQHQELSDEYIKLVEQSLVNY